MSADTLAENAEPITDEAIENTPGFPNATAESENEKADDPTAANHSVEADADDSEELVEIAQESVKDAKTKFPPLPSDTNPTDELYRFLQKAFDHFNQELFDGQLPKCVITVQRERKVMGHFSAERWLKQDGNGAHEIAINPQYFANYPIIEPLQTMVHEQVHLWQYVYSKKEKVSKQYHDKEWAAKMEEVGLMPSDTGLPGGKKTGQKMADYPIPDGKFKLACASLISEGFALDWVDRVAEPAPPPKPTIQAQPSIAQNIEKPKPLEASDAENIETTTTETGTTHDIHAPEIPESLPESVPQLFEDDDPIGQQLQAPMSSMLSGLDVKTVTPSSKSKSKTKYLCPTCDAAVWGKPKLPIICGKCNVSFKEQ